MAKKSISDNSFKGNIIVYLLIVSIAVAIGNFIYSGYNINKLSNQSSYIGRANDIISYSDALLSALKDVELGERGYLITREESYLEHLHKGRTKVDKILDYLEKYAAKEKKYETYQFELDSMIDEKLTKSDELIALRRDRELNSTLKILNLDVHKARLDRIREKINSVQVDIKKMHSDRVEEMNNQFWKFIIFRIPMTMFLLIILLVTIYSIKKIKQTRLLLYADLNQKNREYLLDIDQTDDTNSEMDAVNRLIANLENATKFITEIAKGNYNYQLKGLTNENKARNISNLAGELLEMRQLLLNAKKEENNRKIEDKNRNWATQGIAKFGEILQSRNDNIEKLTDEIIKNIIQYLSANQGGLFLYNDDNTEDVFLELVAAYAFDRKKYMKKKIQLGEGLVGTCASEKEKIYMTKIPNNYIEITSGLGGANPRCILIVPMKIDNKILGVIEIASFNELENYEIEFVEKIAENIATTLSAVKVNSKTSQLLEQAKQQTEEMASQEEEMRQNLEELQATQEEAARQSAEFEGILSAINTTLGSIEYNLDGEIIDANEVVLDKFEVKSKDLLGKTHREFSRIGIENTSEYRQIWNSLKEGKTIKRETNYKKSNTENLWMQETYKPIYDAHDSIYKILAIMIDITEEKSQKDELKLKEKELTKNLNSLKGIQKDMEIKQQQIEIANGKLKRNELILGKALKKTKENEKNLNDKNKKLITQEVIMQKNMEELAKAQVEMTTKQNEISKINDKMSFNEQILKKAINKQNENKIQMGTHFKELTKSKELLNKILNNLPIAIFWKNIDLKYQGCNIEFAKYANMDSPEQIMGKDDSELFWKERAKQYMEVDKNIIQTKTAKLDYIENHQKNDNTTIIINKSKIPLINEKDEVFGLLGIFQDITNLKNT